MGRDILVVEDDRNISDLIQMYLVKEGFDVRIAGDGGKAIEEFQKQVPDLILLDIMLPVMDGWAVCAKIRETSKVPIIMLTAKGEVFDRIQGLEMGADDYISKPFNAKVLLARCNNLVRNRIILQKKFNEQRDFDTQSLASNPIDQKFMDTVNRIVEENLSNMEFDMNTLAKELGLSRSSLYAKFKALTGMTPNDFVLNCKLKRAATLLITRQDLQIAEISDMLGFGSPRYFTRCFKAQFDTTPAEYKKKKAD